MIRFDSVNLFEDRNLQRAFVQVGDDDHVVARAPHVACAVEVADEYKPVRICLSIYLSIYPIHQTIYLSLYLRERTLPVGAVDR